MAFEATDADTDALFMGNTPFEAAAKTGATEIVKVIITTLYENHVESRSLEAAAQDYMHRPRVGDLRSAFLLAAKSLQIGVLRLLLEDDKYGCPGLADMESLVATIQKTAEDTNLEPVEVMKGTTDTQESAEDGDSETLNATKGTETVMELTEDDGTEDTTNPEQQSRDTTQENAENEADDSEDPGLTAFRLIFGKIDPDQVDKMRIWVRAVEAPSLIVIKYLLEVIGQELLNYNYARIIIEKGNIQMWNQYTKEARAQVLREGRQDLLHIAVEYRKVVIVEAILQDFPEQIQVARLQEEDDEEKQIEKREYAMESLRKRPEESDKDANPQSSYCDS